MASATPSRADAADLAAPATTASTQLTSVQNSETTKTSANKRAKSIKAVHSPLATSPLATTPRTVPATSTPTPATEAKMQGHSNPRRTPTKPVTSATKRKTSALATGDTTPTPIKRREGDPNPPKTPRKPRKTGAVQKAAPATPLECPLSKAVQNKIRAVRTFLSSHKTLTPPALSPDNPANDNDNYTAIVDPDDILAALLIMRADYCLDPPFAGRKLTLSDAKEMITSQSFLSDADEMIISHPSPYGIEVDFYKMCPLEHAVQKKIRGWGGELHGVNLVVVELMMFREKKRKFLADGFGCGGVWRFGGRWGSSEGAVSEDVLGGDEITGVQEATDQAAQANGQVVGGI